MSATSRATSIMLMTKARGINHALDILRSLHMANTIVSLLRPQPTPPNGIVQSTRSEHAVSGVEIVETMHASAASAAAEIK